MQSPDYYEFFSQHKIISGNKAMESIPSELDSMNAMKPLVIANKGISKSLIKKFIKAMYDSNLIIGGIVDEVPEYANVTMVNELIGIFKARGCDSIIGIGGGSVMNVAKGVNMLVSMNSNSIMEFEGKDKLPRQLKPLVFISLSHGDGLAASNCAIIDHHQFQSDRLYPDIVCIDPRMVRGCCGECVAETALIALTQAIEASSEQFHSPMNDAYAHPSIQLISENLRKGVKRLKNKKASMALANAATIASTAFSNSPIGVISIIAESIQTLFGNPKGITMGIILPFMLEEKAKSKIKVRDELLLALAGFDVYVSTPKNERVKVAIDLIKNLLKGLKGIVPLNLKELGIQKYQLTEVASLVAQKSGKRISLNDCLALLETAYGK